MIERNGYRTMFEIECRSSLGKRKVTSSLDAHKCKMEGSIIAGTRIDGTENREANIWISDDEGRQFFLSVTKENLETLKKALEDV